MRDLLFKALTSQKKKRRCLSLTENIAEQGYLAKSARHVIYSLEEIPDSNTILNKPILSVTKFHDSRTNEDKLFCKMKGKIFASFNKKIYLISFIHTLRIALKEGINYGI